MLERLLIAGALLLLVLAALGLGRRWYARRNARIEERLRASMPVATEAASPRIVYFTTTTCVVCKAQQEPAMTAVAARASDVRIERHDAVEERAIADEYGVLSVPTTAVYDRQGQLVAINRGFAPAAVLLAQIEGREPSLEGGAPMASEPLTTSRS